MTKRIVITGKGVICSIGATPESVMESLRADKPGIGAFRHLDSGHHELPVGEAGMSDAELKHELGIDQGRETSRTTLLGAYALRQAMHDAKLSCDKLSGKRIVLISGTTVGGMDVTERHFAKDDNCSSYISMHECGSNTAEIAAIAGLDCKCLTISTACSSALNAIILGARMLLNDEADIVFAGGSEALSRFHLNGFNSLMILDNEPCRPFDATRRGLNLGEGAAYVVLSREDDKAGEIQAYIAGYGNRCDAFHQTATSPDGEGAFLAMREAIAMSRIPASKIGYVNAHGTGTPDNDRSESAALKRIFTDRMPPISSTKSFTGHTTSASGSIEAVISVSALQQGYIPGNHGWKNPDPLCITPTEGKEAELDYVLCNSFGFGGNDSSLLLSRIPAELPSHRADAKPEIAACSKITEEDDLSEVKRYVPAMEARRMSNLMKAATLTSMRVLEEAGIEQPDAIVIGTRFGMLEQGEKILNHLNIAGEEGLSPTLFMQSTHNTIAGTLAIRLGCKGYNLTLSNATSTRSDVLAEAERLIAEGKAKTVLAGVHDMIPDGFNDLFAKAGIPIRHRLSSEAFLIRAID